MKLHWIGASKSAPNAARAKIIAPPPAAVDGAPRFIFHEGERLQDLAHLGKSVAQVNVSVSSLQGSEGDLSLHPDPLERTHLHSSEQIRCACCALAEMIQNASWRSTTSCLIVQSGDVLSRLMASPLGRSAARIAHGDSNGIYDVLIIRKGSSVYAHTNPRLISDKRPIAEPGPYQSRNSSLESATKQICWRGRNRIWHPILTEQSMRSTAPVETATLSQSMPRVFGVFVCGIDAKSLNTATDERRLLALCSPEGKPMLGFGLDHAANRDNIASTLIQAITLTGRVVWMLRPCRTNHQAVQVQESPKMQRRQFRE